MLYDYSTEYKTKYSATCYDEDINSTGKNLVKFQQIDSVSGLMA